MRKPKDIITNGITLQERLDLHIKWLNSEEGGVRLKLPYADLQGTNLRGADLRDVIFRYTDLRGADLRDVILRYADLRYADLRGVDLLGVDLLGANLQGADLRGVDLDYSQLNLSCKGLNFKIDERIAKQLMYHVINLMQYSDLNVNKWVKKQTFKDLEDSHVVIEHGLDKLDWRKNNGKV